MSFQDNTEDDRGRAPSRVGGLLAVAVVVVALAALASQVVGPTATGDSAEPTRTPNDTSPRFTGDAEPAEERTAVVDNAAPPTVEPVRGLPEPVSVGYALITDESVGLWLFYGGSDPLQRLDLDTGIVDTFDVRAAPTLVTGGELVLRASGSIGWVGINDPGAIAQGWVSARVHEADEPGQVWLFSEMTSDWVRQDLATRAELEVRSLPSVGAPIAHSPDLASFAGGIYAWFNDDYRRVADGQPFAFSDDVVITAQCGPTLSDCTVEWLDRETWKPLPVVTADMWPDPPEEVLSPDGRFEAVLKGAGEVRVIDRTNGRVTTYGFPVHDDGGEVLLVAKPAP